MKRNIVNVYKNKYSEPNKGKGGIVDEGSRTRKPVIQTLP